jgi:hypothetical protein
MIDGMRSRRTSVSEFDDRRDISHVASAVSLHAHTHHSRESLAEVPDYIKQVPVLGHRFVRELRTCLDEEGCASDYSRVWWHPPVSARTVFESETDQIDRRFGLASLVSITDHDDIAAGLELQALYAPRRAPISFEWTVPYGCGFFHLGIHNLPPDSALCWFARLRAVTVRPTPEAVTEALADLDALGDTLVVFNHPHWDLADVGADAHARSVREFLDGHGRWIHALELNGYRSWRENDSVRPLAAALGLPLISGGDRHGAAANAILNLTRARTFTDFVAEVRGGVSHVVVMPEYRQHLATRILSSASDVLRSNPAHPPGLQRWTDRVSWDTGGTLRKLSYRWPDGGPFWVRSAVGAFSVLTSPAVLPVIGAALELSEGVLARSAPVSPAGRAGMGPTGVGSIGVSRPA